MSPKSEKDTQIEENVQLTIADINRRHKERVDKIMSEHGFETTEQFWEVPDELHALHDALAEDYRAQAGIMKPNRKALSLSVEEESDDVAEAETAESKEDAGDGV